MMMFSLAFVIVRIAVEMTTTPLASAMTPSAPVRFWILRSSSSTLGLLERLYICPGALPLATSAISCVFVNPNAAPSYIGSLGAP